MALTKCDDVDDPFAMDPFAEEEEYVAPTPAAVVSAAIEDGAVMDTSAPIPKDVKEAPSPVKAAAPREKKTFKGFDAADEETSEQESPSPVVAPPRQRPAPKGNALSFGGFDAEDDQYQDSALGTAVDTEDAAIFAADQHHMPFARAFQEAQAERDMTPTPAVAATDEAGLLEASLQSLQTADEDDAFLNSLSRPKAGGSKAKPVKKAEAKTAGKASAGVLDDDLFSMGGGMSQEGEAGGEDFDFSSYIAKNKAGTSRGGGLFD